MNSTLRTLQSWLTLSEDLRVQFRLPILYRKQKKIEVCDSFQGIKKQATLYKAACDCHNSKCDKSEFVSFSDECIHFHINNIVILFYFNLDSFEVIYFLLHRHLLCVVNACASVFIICSQWLHVKAKRRAAICSSCSQTVDKVGVELRVLLPFFCIEWYFHQTPCHVSVAESQDI